MNFNARPRKRLSFTPIMLSIIKPMQHPSPCDLSNVQIMKSQKTNECFPKLKDLKKN